MGRLTIFNTKYIVPLWIRRRRASPSSAIKLFDISSHVR